MSEHRIIWVRCIGMAWACQKMPLQQWNGGKRRQTRGINLPRMTWAMLMQTVEAFHMISFWRTCGMPCIAWG